MIIGDTDINKIARGTEEKHVEGATVAELQKKLAEKDQEIESLQGRVRKMEIKKIIGERSGHAPGP